MKSSKSFLTLTIIFFILLYTHTSAEIVKDGLVSYWTFDKSDIVNKTLKDVWGENNATIHGRPDSVQGIIGEAFKFDGRNDFIDLTSLGDFGKHLGTSTFEAWIKTTNKQDWMTLVNTHAHVCPSWGIELNGHKSSFDLRLSEGMVYYEISLRKVDGTGCGGVTRGGSHPVFDGKWHHLVYTLDYVINPLGGSGNRRVYIDSVVYSGGTHSFGGKSDFFPFTDPVYLGAREHNNIPHSFFEGYIDEVRFYNRPLTAEEVFRNYSSNNPFKVGHKDKLTTVWGKLKQ